MTQLFLQWINKNDMKVGKISLTIGILWLVLEWWALAVK
jgi:hypothetical protein